VAGREFTAAEVREDAKVVIVNEPFAAQFGQAGDALGHQISVRGARRIIGVVKGMDYMTNNPMDANPRQIFIPSITPGGFFSTFVARVDGRAEDRLAMIRDAIQSVDPQVPVFGAKTMEQRLGEVLSRPRFYRTAVLSFAAFALLLAVIGIYGIVSYAVSQRTREMGVRMALGATPARLRLYLLRQGLVTPGAGVIPGIAGAALSGRFLKNLVEGATPATAVSYATSVVFIALIAGVSIWMATRPIAHLDITEVLRTE
jgi:ABC-type antimicrobial peptide transport system permease subunit